MNNHLEECAAMRHLNIFISLRAGLALLVTSKPTVIYTCNMFVLLCACDVMNVLFVQKMKIYTKKIK